MTLSTSRQQFLAYESTAAAEDLQYSRRGGVFFSTFVCIGLVIFAVVLAALVGVIVYFITYFKLTQKPADFWAETEPFGQTGPPSPDLRLPGDVVPSFYRLKIKTDLEHSNFTGEVYITIRASKKVKEIVLHSKNLSIINNAKLTEQIYEKVEMVHSRRRRDVDVKNNTTNAAPENITTTNEHLETTRTMTPLNVTITETKQPGGPVEENSTSIQNNSTDFKTTILTAVNFTESTTKASAMNVTETVTPEVILTTQTQVTHSNVRDIKILSIKVATGDRLILTLATTLKPNVDYILEIPFEGQISDSLTGFYKSTYINADKEEKKLAVTQFEPTSARSAFPCFDEPAFKAKFEISIAHRKNLTVLSNMKVATVEPIKNEPDWEWTHFERSVKMSTYLVAYIISDFKALETSYLSKDNITKPIRVWTRPELLKKAEYAVKITPKLLEYYEDVFGVPYALDKLDLIAIPDFSSGAMENWGLITFRETTLLFDEANSVPRDKQNVAIDIAHELAHQWFGNLVTMNWWGELWLNEGFATYIEYVGVDKIEPSWNMFESFTRDMLELLHLDSLKNTSPVSRKVVDASEISQKFDEISYAKGANLIRMLNNTMSEELFHKGLVHYLNQWKFANAEENDLWESMSIAVSRSPAWSGRSLVKFMNSWTKQPGYPLLSVTRDYTTGRVTFKQQLFSTSSDPYKKMLDQLWQIPINYVTLDGSPDKWSRQPRVWLTEKQATVNLPVNASQALYVNIDATGYYRVNYDQRNWELLSQALQSGSVKSPVTRAQLIDDAFNLAKTNHLNYSYALGLTTYAINGEDSKIVWDMLLNNMAFLKYCLKATSGYVYFQDYITILLRKELELLNYGLNKPVDDNQAFIIENLVTWECNMESPRCLDWARSQLNSFMEKKDYNDNPIPSYLRSLVYNVGLKYGGRREFDFLWNMFLNSTEPAVSSLAVTSLPSTREESLITTLLERSLSGIPKQYAVAVWGVEPPVGTRIAQDFLIDNFQRVYDTFTEMDSFMFPNVLSGAFGYITTQEELDKLKSFALSHKEQLMPMSQTLQKLVDTAALRIAWTKQHAAEITTWFKHFVSNRNNSTTTNATTIPSNLRQSNSVEDSTKSPNTVVPPQSTPETTEILPQENTIVPPRNETGTNITNEVVTVPSDTSNSTNSTSI